MARETDARMVIDHLLGKAGWDIFDKSQVSTEEPAADGRADYLLKNTRSQPLAVLEAKRFSIDPYSAKEKAKGYAIAVGAPFIILSNGREHYLWEHEYGDARPILGMPSQADLERRANLRQHRQGDLATSLHALEIPTVFRFQGEELRPHSYQVNCLKAMDAALIAGRRRMLIEMATGAGKTMTIAMLMKRWFKAALVSRVLFLVDRIELAKQAKNDTFDDYLRDHPTTILFGGKKSLEGQIVVGTLDTIAGQLGPGGFGHAYFDLVITDECHRSIYNSHRATLAHFDAIHIGLTATPNPGELVWVSEHERQLVRSTYMFFDCWNSAKQDGEPTFRYSIQEGIRDKVLADYKVYSAESKLTFEGTEWEDEEISLMDWGKTAESEDRLKLIIEEYFRVEEEREQPHPRKTIVFAVGERQAIMLERLFNRLLPDAACLRIAEQTNRSPGEVRQSFAQKITCYSNNGQPKPIIDRFKFDPLPVVAVSVDMLDTGYNHKEVENLVMLRPTTSAIKYAQMRGRGSRMCPRIGKTSFLIYDFVGNYERFNDPAEPYHRPREKGQRPGPTPPVPPGGGEGGPEPTPPPLPPEPQPREFKLIAEGQLEDEIRKRQLIHIGPEGMAIDRKTYQDRWRERVLELQKTDPVVGKILAGEDITEEEWNALNARLNAPEFYFEVASLQRAFEQPTGSLTDFIRVALGLHKFPTHQERIERAFTTWIAEHSNSVNPDQAHMLRLLRNVVIAAVEENKYQTLEPEVFNHPAFRRLGGRHKVESLFGQQQLADILAELRQLLIAA